MEQTIGQKISPTLVEIENLLWEHEYFVGTHPRYTIDGFRAATKIFMSVLMDKMWELQSNENISMDDRINMVEKAGNEVRNLIKIFTDIDTHELYKNKSNTNT